MEAQAHIIGIDLGTTNSVVAVIEGGEPVVIANAEGHNKTPSVVTFLDDGSAVVGEIACRQASTRPRHTVSSAKRLIGRFYQEVADDEDLFPFKLAENEDGRAAIDIEGRAMLPEEISALVIEKLKAAAEDYLGESVARAVITVPAYFDDVQRQATMEAAKLAGLEVLRLFNEPTAAAMAYGLGREGQQHIVAVYDFGGGTFDFSLLEIDGKTFEVLTTTGNSRLGGDDLDNLIVDHLADQFQSVHSIDLRQDIMSLRRLKEAAERAKCELSSTYQAMINLPFIAMHDGKPLHLEAMLTREVLEDLIEPLVKETLACCTRGLHQAHVNKKDISKVILVGGSTRIPLVQDSVEEFFGLTPFKGLNPDEIVAIGAAIQGAVMNGALDEVVLLDVTPHCLGLELKGNRKSVLIEKNSTIPIKVCKTFTTTEENQAFVNIHALQGDSEKASECRSLGKFTLSGIQQAPAGIPRIRVTFFINADGIVEITATDSQSGVEKSLSINHAYLSTDERRTGSSSYRLRRRRRQAALAGRGGRTTSAGLTTTEHDGTDHHRTPYARRMREAESVEAQTPLPPAQLPADATPLPAARRSLSDSFQEIAATEDTAPKLPPTPPTPPASQTPQTPPTPETPPTPPPSPAPAAPSAVAESGQSTKTKWHDLPRPVADQTQPHNPQVVQCPIPSRLNPVIRQLSQAACDAQACELYQAARTDFLEFCQRNPEELALQLLLARFHAYTRQAAQAADVLEHVRAHHPELLGQVLDAYDELCRLFPEDAAARKNRAAVALAVGDLKLAMTDLEFASQLDESDEQALDQLDQVYSQMLREQPDNTLKFRLIKLHLRRQRLDAAIGLLQQLVMVAEYRDRANKVLGLCFWQKGMRYLAWQKFRALPLDDELKDVLYRLAEDMERHDELLHAKYALERIYEQDISFRDVADRIKDVTRRLQVQREDRILPPPNRAVASLLSGSEFNRRFEIIEEINRGSMGIVYKARDLTLDETVAIKVLNDYLCTDPEAVERFKAEARSARKLTHNNIVRIHDMFDLDGKKIISMEYIEGENLKTILARQATFSEDTVLNYLMQVCEGLAYAHRLHVVHRDIKPANIMTTERGLVKITDFGIAKLLTEHQTKAGTAIMGTPLYMAPEQIEGSRIDHRCDIYSLGIMLYEMVTGMPPFHEGNIEYQHIHTAPPEIKAGLSPKLRRIIMRCIEKKPSSRFHSVEEILTSII